MALRAYYVTVIEDRPLMSAEYHLPLSAKTDSSCSAMSAIAEILVIFKNTGLQKFKISSITW